jgi:hypothetical protein
MSVLGCRSRAGPYEGSSIKKLYNSSVLETITVRKKISIQTLDVYNILFVVYISECLEYRKLENFGMETFVLAINN